MGPRQKMLLANLAAVPILVGIVVAVRLSSPNPDPQVHVGAGEAEVRGVRGEPLEVLGRPANLEAFLARWEPALAFEPLEGRCPRLEGTGRALPGGTRALAYRESVESLHLFVLNEASEVACIVWGHPHQE